MRDQGLQEAIRAAGGISALARLLGVSQPSISEWNRIPAERVAAVEAVTSVSRAVLRPDLFAADDDRASHLDAVEQGRANLYLLISNLVLRVPDEPTIIQISQLKGDETPLGRAMSAVGAAADIRLAGAIAKEHFDLFVGVGRGELLPYASYYLTGFLYERPLVRVRQDLKRLGLERGEGYTEPEDHVGFLFEAMAGLILRRVDAEAHEDRRFFERHVQPWAEKFFDDLAKIETARFYQSVGALGREFMRIEHEAFLLDSDGDEMTLKLAKAGGAR